MIYSMTGFSAQQREAAGGTLLLELRSVNHRYLELQLRLDETLRGFETSIREVIAGRLGRGKVECRLSFTAASGAASAAQLDNAVLEQVALLGAAVQQRFPQSQPLSVADILRWPGVLTGAEVSADKLASEVIALVEQGLQDLAEARAREGEKLKALILERAAAMETQVAKVRPLLPALMQAYQDKLAARLREALQSVDEERVRQELTLFAQKIDVDEELSRLTTHLQEVKRILSAGGAVGKRLDFLMQELNREANTLGSKSASTEVSQVSMELKVLIEQMREQIQNIE
ncbi:MAG TPA: YicC family protein [Methylophilaceae bacterium]|nr:YicC family protein [Methylophilaceae bacterium]